MIEVDGYLKFNGYNTISMLFGPLNEKKVENQNPKKRITIPPPGLFFRRSTDSAATAHSVVPS